MSTVSRAQINEAPIFSADDPNGPPIDQYDHPIYSQVCTPNLSDMAEEVLVPILKDIDTLHTLWGVITASRRLYAVFHHYAVEIVDAILERGPTPEQVSNRMRAIFVVRFILPNADAARDVLDSGSPTDENDMTIEWPAFSEIPGPVQASNLCKLVRLAYHIHGLAHCCLETSLEKCKKLLARPNHEFDLLAIPPQIAHTAGVQNANLSRRNIMWSVKVEEDTILSIWRLQYLYQIQDAISKAGGGDSGGLASLLSNDFLPFESLPKFFHSHVREQVLTVFTILDGLHHIPRAKPKPDNAHVGRPMSKKAKKDMKLIETAADIRGPNGGLRRTQAMEWLNGQRDSDEEPPNEDDERQLDAEFAWSCRHGPWKLPELRHVTSVKDDNPSWHRCAIAPAPVEELQALVHRPKWSRTFHPSEQEDHDFAMALELSLNSGEEFEEADSSSSYLNWGRQTSKPPAWTFLKTIKRPDVSRFTNLAELTLPIRPYRELGVFLFDEELLNELGLWPVGGLHSEHTEKKAGTVGEIDKYAWQWIKLLSRVKQSELISEEEMAGWRAMGHLGRRRVLECLDIPAWVRREFEWIEQETENWMIPTYAQYMRRPKNKLLNELDY